MARGVRASKCQFMTPKMEYLGHLIDKDCIRPTPAKVTAIKNAPAPTTVKELLCFLGMVTYHSEDLPFRAGKLAPLYELLRQDSTWRWGSEQQESFRWAQDALTSDSFLAHLPEWTATRTGLRRLARRYWSRVGAARDRRIREAYGVRTTYPVA